MTRQQSIERVRVERERQFDLPGREFDVCNTPNDWVAIIVSYASEGISRNHNTSSTTDFEDALIKAGAVILAALEHVEAMQRRGNLR